MAFSIPTFRDILTRVQTDLGSAADGTSPRATPEYAISRALTGVSKHLFSAVQYVIRQCSPITADETYGWRWAAPFGITQGAATSWQGTATVTGDDTTLVPAGTEYSRSDGLLYTTDADVTIGGTETATVALTASAAGADSDNEDGQLLSLTASVTGLDTDAVVASSTAPGSNVERWDPEGKNRLLLRLRNPPKGGTAADWVSWALEVPGVTRAWAFPLLEADNSVSVAFVRDNDGAGAAIVPDSGERSTVLTHLVAKAPVTTTAKVITLTAQTVNITLSALDPNTTAVHAAIEASLADLFAREGAPGTTLAHSRIEDAISSAVGEESHVTTVPAADIVTPTNQIPVLGTVTYP